MSIKLPENFYIVFDKDDYATTLDGFGKDAMLKTRNYDYEILEHAPPLAYPSIVSVQSEDKRDILYIRAFCLQVTQSSDTDFVLDIYNFRGK